MKIAKRLSRRKAADFTNRLWRSLPSFDFSIDWFARGSSFPVSSRSSTHGDIHHHGQLGV